MEYYLCEAKTAKKLQRIVNRHLEAGWRPIGGVAVTQSQNTSAWWYYQAVVREQESAKLATISRGESTKPPATGLGDFE